MGGGWGEDGEHVGAWHGMGEGMGMRRKMGGRGEGRDGGGYAGNLF
jgi:hypothetical protein